MDLVREIKGLIPFLTATEQNELDFLGRDINIIFWSYDVKTNEFLFTEGMEKIYGYKYEEINGLGIWDILYKHADINMKDVLAEAIRKLEPFKEEYKVTKRDGTVGWVRTKGRPIFSAQNELLRYNGHSLDISINKFFEIEREESENKYRTLVENYALGVYISQDGKYKYVNDRLSEITGYSQAELLDMEFDQLLDSDSKDIVLKRVHNFLNGKKNEMTEINLVHKDTSTKRVELYSTLISYQDKLALMGTILDITEKKQAQEMVNYLAYHDSLTDIPNRNLFNERSHHELLEMRDTEKKAALLFIDLDQFKIVNDTLGHHEGDIILKKIATKIKVLVGDKGQIARYGGDEFVVLLKYDELHEVEEFSNILLHEIPHSISCQIKVSPSIGISLFPQHGKDIESLIRFADMAIYDLKSNDNRKQNYIFYDEFMSTNRIRTNQLSNDLHNAIDEHQLYIAFQPKLNMNTLKIEGLEALIRWNHPLYGNISPDEFIPLAENNGFIHKMGDWVLKNAINETLKLHHPITLNVNISTRQLLRGTFVESIKTILEETQFPAAKLNLEITESVALHDVEKSVEILNQLKSIGILISLDDFGTGYSSLSYLTKLPVDYLKIDRSFINDLENNDSNKTVVKSIIKVAHSLNMKVTAEGIETKKQAEILRKYGCDNCQGYYFSKPLPFNEIQVYLEQSISKRAWYSTLR